MVCLLLLAGSSVCRCLGALVAGTLPSPFPSWPPPPSLRHSLPSLAAVATIVTAVGAPIAASLFLLHSFRFSIRFVFCPLPPPPCPPVKRGGLAICRVSPPCATAPPLHYHRLYLRLRSLCVDQSILSCGERSRFVMSSSSVSLPLFPSLLSPLCCIQPRASERYYSVSRPSANQFAALAVYSYSFTPPPHPSRVKSLCWRVEVCCVVFVLSLCRIGWLSIRFMLARRWRIAVVALYRVPVSLSPYVPPSGCVSLSGKECGVFLVHEFFRSFYVSLAILASSSSPLNLSLFVSLRRRCPLC